MSGPRGDLMAQPGRPLLVISRRIGRLANHLLIYSHCIGAGLEHGFDVANPVMGKYADYFPNCRDLFCRFPATRTPPAFGRPGRETVVRAAEYYARALHWRRQRGSDVGLLRIGREDAVDLDSPEFLERLRRHGTLFIWDWFFRSADACERHAAAIRRHLTPWKRHMDSVRAVVEPVRERDRFLIGVHIRQGDYASFKGGAYFFTHHQYRQAIDRVRELYSDRELTFLVSSDAPVPDHLFADLDIVRPPGQELEDLYCLAACDRLIGPPSTYAKWASFYGDVPRYELWDPARAVREEDFVVCSRLKHDRDWGVPPRSIVSAIA